MIDFEKAKTFSYKDFLTLSADKAFELAGSSSGGLNTQEAGERLKVFGLNELGKEDKVSALKIFLEQLSSPLLFILFVASVISGILGDHTDMIIIISMIILSSVLGFVQEYRSQKAVALLAKTVSPAAEVIRDGKEKKIPASQLVIGDVVEISAGDVVSADLRIIEANNLSLNESVLTGESFEAEKEAVALNSKDLVPQDAKNIAFMGTSVMSGVGRGIVVATAASSQLGKTANYLKTVGGETEFQVGIRKFGKFLVVVTLILVLFVFLINAALGHGNSVLESLLFALALAIGITPEFLPAIITINLSQGAVEMAKKDVIVKKLISIEDLGNINILCTDKTGTLTEGQIKLFDFFDAEERHSREVILGALLSNSGEKINPLETAISRFAGEGDYGNNEVKKYKDIDYLSFDFKRRMNSVLVTDGEKRFIFSKGAVESVLGVCSSVLIHAKKEKAAAYEKDILEKVKKFGERGLRLMAVASREADGINSISPSDEKDMTFLGFLVFGDQLKQTAKSTIKKLNDLGIEIKILTGDNEYISRHVAEQVGLNIENIISGDDILKLSDGEFDEAVKKTSVFYRITPEHKLKIIQSLKSTGETVGFLGDGVNDSPALKAADVGISVNSAVPIARAAADIILMKSGLEVILEGVKEGRRTFGNTMKYIFNATSSNFGNMISVAGASVLLPFLPLLPSQIIILNFLGDVPSVAIASDNVDEEYLRKPKKWDIKAIARFMLPFGILSSFFDFTTFFLLLYLLKANIAVFRGSWFVESLITEVLVIFIIRTKRMFFKSKPSKLLFITSLVSIIAGLILVFTPLASYFKFQNPPYWFFGVILAIVLVYLLLAEAVKEIYYRKMESQ
ncbi:magnesium-translocating P-type ATPase [Patescibacteria group bacterium]|nr:magnesium-translocating P-type ATPase [Patescibacteria group bacterium]MCL5733539.1 magnesium-translocating P-type ATPase [Patescibacteria group bacterium]